MPKLYAHHTGTWKQVQLVWLNISGVWTLLKHGFAYTGGSYQRFYPDTTNLVGSNVLLFNTPNTSQDWTVPAGITNIAVEVVGGGGGGGGWDGDGQTGHNGYPGKKILLTALAVTPGQVFSFSVGGGGGRGIDIANSSGGGAGGASLTHAGGAGGNAGTGGYSGGGGGGGGATVVYRNATLLLAGAGGGGGGGAGRYTSGRDQVSPPLYTANGIGGAGENKSGDGAGGGGGGGGNLGGQGGLTYGGDDGAYSGSTGTVLDAGGAVSDGTNGGSGGIKNVSPSTAGTAGYVQITF